MRIFDRIRYEKIGNTTKNIAVENPYIFEYKGVEIFVEKYKGYNIIYNDNKSLQEVKALIDLDYNFLRFWDEEYNELFGEKLKDFLSDNSL